MKYFYLLFINLFLCIGLSYGQKTVLGKPEAFLRPLDREDFVARANLKPSKEAWVVVNDRANNITYKKDKKTKFKTLDFKDWFYVTEIKKGWIRLTKATVVGKKIRGKSEDYGWIRMEKMLLWSSGLLDPSSKINRKAFLLNRMDDVSSIMDQVDGGEKKEIVQIYRDPAGKTIADSKKIYEFYFILKKEGDYYLLSKAEKISTRTVNEALVGWVRKNRLTDWNTRIALEPNFKINAYQERASNKSLRVVAYGTDSGAKNHAESGRINIDEAFWDNDPISIKKEQLATTNPRRFKGGVVRFPLLSQQGNYYRSGVIGKITIRDKNQKELEYMGEIPYGGLLKAIENSGASKENYNILYVIEGTASMQPFKASIIESIRETSLALSKISNVKFGASIYRDIPEREVGKLFENIPLTSNPEDVIAYLNTREFKNWLDNDSYTSMYYGLQQAILESGLNQNHTNIVILIGNYGDYSPSYIRRKNAKNSNDNTFISTTDLEVSLAENNIHLLALQCRDDRDNASKYFSEGAGDRLLESAKYQYRLISDVKSIFPINIREPLLPSTAYETCTNLNGGVSLGRICKPSGSTMNNAELVASIIDFSNGILSHVSGFWNHVSKVVDDGNSIEEIDLGVAGPGFIKELKKLLQERGRWSKTDVQNLLREKYRLYTEVYVPVKIKGATHNAFSQVLFMPKPDLENYLKTLNELKLCSDASMDQQRNCLYESMLALYEQFSGNSELNKRTSIEDLNNIMQGLEKEGLQVSTALSRFKIDDILKEKKVSNDLVKGLIDRFIANTSNLQKILKEGKNHEFSFSSLNNTYFWVPIEYASF